jgi:hypothetical protein
MNTLTLDQLAADTARLKAQFGGYYPTSILGLKARPGIISAVASEVEVLAELVADAEKAGEESAKEIKKLEDQIDKKDEEIDQLKELLSEKEEGKTILEWKLEADEARAAAEVSRKNAMEWHEELVAVRKKKGVQAGWHKYGYELTALAEDVRLGGRTPGETAWGKAISKKADELLSKIRNTK